MGLVPVQRLKAREKALASEKPTNQAVLVDRDLLAFQIVQRQPVAQFIQHHFERRAFRAQFALQGAAANAHLLRHRVDIGIAGVQDRHQETLDLGAQGFRAFELLQERIGAFAQLAEHEAVAGWLAQGGEHRIDEKTGPLAFEGQRRFEDALVLRAIGRRLEGEMRGERETHRLKRWHGFERRTRVADEAGELGLYQYRMGDVGRMHGLHPEPLL